MLFSQVLRTIRLERELSQRELARLSGLSANAISYYEKNARIPGIDAVQKLADALGVNATIFFSPKEYEEFLENSKLYKRIRYKEMAKDNFNSKMLRLEKKDAFNNIVKEIAVLNNMTESGVVESTIFEKYLPSHPLAREWCIKFLYDCKESGIKETLEVIFKTLSLGINGSVSYNNIEKLVEYAAQLSVHYPNVKVDEISLERLEKEANAVHELIEKNSEKDMIDIKTGRIELYDLYYFVLSNWAYLKNSTLTYSFLACVVSLQEEFTPEPGEKRKLCEIIELITNDWTD